MKKILALLALLSIQAMGITNVTLPYIVDTASIPKVKYVDKNDSALKWGVNNLGDTVNAASGTGLLLRRTGATGVSLASPTETGTSSLSILNVSGKTTLSDSLVGVSERLSGTLEAAGNIYTSGTGTGYWMNNPGTFTYGMYTSGGSLLFRSGSTSPWLTVNSSGQPTLSTVLTGTDAIFGVDDNSTGVFVIKENTNDYLRLNTSNGSEAMKFGNATTNPSFQFLGTGNTYYSGKLFLDGGFGAYLDASATGSHAGQGIRIYADNATLSATFNATNQTNTGDLIFTSTTTNIRGNTSDGSDNQRFAIGPGGSSGSVSRGGFFYAEGNEYGGVGGGIIIAAGNTVNGKISLATGNQTNRLVIDSSGASTFSGTVSISGATASTAAAFDASKNLISVTNTGTGNNVLSASPTLTGTIAAANQTLSGTLGVTGVATFMAAPVFSSVTASQILSVDGSKNLTSMATTGSGSVMLAASPTTTGTLGATNGTYSGTLGVTGVATFTSTITADSIISSKFYAEGSFTITATGMTSATTGTAKFTRIGKNVTLYIPNLFGTSNSTACTLTGLPSSLWPSLNQNITITGIEDNSLFYAGGILQVQNGGIIQPLFQTTMSSASGPQFTFTSSGGKGIVLCTLTYTLQ